ncbi:MAG: multiheme c-type cytochrome [Sulfurimonas sp.]
MIRYLVIFNLLFVGVLFGNIAVSPDKDSIVVKGKFSKNKKCIRCHLDIYKEFKHSKHRHSNISNNLAHKVMWEGNPISKEKSYVCAKCHAPAAENIEQLMAKGGDVNASDPSLDEGISCAACHRIEDIDRSHKVNEYIISKKKRLFRGTRQNQQESPYHDIELGNKHFKSADVCLTCHAHHKKQKKLIMEKGEDDKTKRYCVFSGVDEETTQKGLNTQKENCITCHMPQVPGSHSDRVYAPTHASHTFAAISTRIDEPEKYIDLNLTKEDNSFSVTVFNKLPHDLILHPTRLFILKIFVNDKLVKEHKFAKPWESGKHKPLAWLKENIVYKDNLLAKSKKSIKVQRVLEKKDKVRVELGYHTFDPKLAKEIGLEDEKSTQYRVFVEKRF